MANRGAFASVVAVPAAATKGGMPTLMYHVKCTCGTTGAGTYLIPHGLPYTPSACIVLLEEAESTTAPAATNGIASWCPADTDATNVAVNIPATITATYHVYYG